MTRLKLWLGFIGMPREGSLFTYIFFPFIVVLTHNISILTCGVNIMLTFSSYSRTLTFDLTKYQES